MINKLFKGKKSILSKLVFLAYSAFSLQMLRFNGPWFFLFLALIPSSIYALWQFIKAISRRRGPGPALYNFLGILLALFISFGFLINWDFSFYSGYINPDKVQVAQVVRAIDGDSIEVEFLDGSRDRVRMIGIDTPETVHPRKEVEYFGKEAYDFTRSSLEGREVYLEKDISNRDIYGNLLRYVWLKSPNKISLSKIRKNLFNAKLIDKSYARVVSFPPDLKYWSYFRTLELESRKEGLGIWNKEKREDFQNFPTIKELYKEHGKSLNFLGVIMSNLNVALEQKKRSAVFVAQMAKSLGADGAIVTEEGYGNPDADYILCLAALEDVGIKTVGISNECTGRDGASQPLVTLDVKANALVSTGNVSEIIELPPADKVIGELEALGRDGLSGGWAYDEILGGSVREGGSIIMENNAMFCGDMIAGWSTNFHRNWRRR